METMTINDVQPETTIPYKCGVLCCTVADLVKNPSIILCNARGDSVFYFDDFEGRPLFLVSPALKSHSTRMRKWKKSKTEVIPWGRYSYRTGSETDFLVSRRYLKRCCRFLGLKLEKDERSDKQIAADKALAERGRQSLKVNAISSGCAQGLTERGDLSLGVKLDGLA